MEVVAWFEGKQFESQEVKHVAAEFEEIQQNIRNYTIFLNVSGCDKNELLIHIADGMLRLEKADSRKTELLFSFLLPADVDKNRIKAIFLQNKLKIVLKKQAPKRSVNFTLNSLLKAIGSWPVF